MLRPSGEDIMLPDIRPPFNEGDLVELTLTFERAGPIGMEATAEPVGALGVPTASIISQLTTL